VAIGDASLRICGCEEPWSERDWNLPQGGTGEPILALTHTADNIYRLNRDGVNVVFAGHSHAGQIQIPWLGPLVVPSDHGRCFDHGHFVIRGTHLFVTAGVGVAGPPLRIYCQPDIFVVDFKASPPRQNGRASPS
jgi:predicted MPP superfamily phosphohydrolase